MPRALAALVVVAAALLPGCLQPLDSASVLGGGDLVPVSGCEVADACNVMVSSGGRANEPSVAVSPTDPMHAVVGIHDYATPTGDVWCAVHVTRDGGSTWSKGFLPGYPGDDETSALSGYTVAGDPALAFGPDGELYYAGIAFHRTLYNVAVFVARSDDGGDTWPHVAIVNRGASTLVFNDKEYIAVDPATGDVYLTWTLFRFTPNPLPVSVPVEDPLGRGQIVVSKSSDKGVTWSTPTLLSDTTWNQGSVPVVAPDGTVHVVWNAYRGEEDVAVQHVASTDGGKTWSEPEDVAPVSLLPPILPNTRFRVNSMPTFAVDRSEGPRHGTLYVAWADNATGHGDVLLASSADGGASWSAPARVNPDATTTDQFMPWMAVDESGGVHVLYLDRSDDPENVAYVARLASSADGGASWTTTLLSDVPSDDAVGRPTNVLGREGGTFIGDYSALAVGGGRAYPVWPDLRHRDEQVGQVDGFTTVVLYG